MWLNTWRLSGTLQPCYQLCLYLIYTNNSPFSPLRNLNEFVIYCRMNLLKPLKFLMRKFTPLFPQPAKNAVQAEAHKSRGGKGAGAIAFIFALISRKVNFIILVSRLDEFSGFSPHPKPLPRKEGGASRLDFPLPLFTGGAFGVGYWPGRPAVLRLQRTARVRGFPSLVGILAAVLLVACQPLAQSTDIHVRVVADGKERVYTANATTTVA